MNDVTKETQTIAQASKKYDIVFIKGDVNKNEYRLKYRCSNCGIIFEFDIRKGQSASTMNGTCPNCSVKSGSPGIGFFSVIKLNDILDQNPRHYFK